MGEESGQGGLAIEEGDQSFTEVVIGGGVAGRRTGGARWAHLREEGGIIAGDAMLVGIEAGGEGGESRATEGGGHIATGEESTLRGQAIEVGRFDQGMAHEPVIGPGVVIGDDEDDVRAWRWGGGLGGGGEGEK